MERFTKLIGRAGQFVIGFLTFVTTSWALLPSAGKIPGILWYAGLLGLAWAYDVTCLMDREVSATLNVHGEPQRLHRFQGRARYALYTAALLIPSAGAVGFHVAGTSSGEGDRDILILVADFDGPDAEYGVTEAIFEELRELEISDPQLRIRSAGVKITSKDGPSVAERVARDNAASVIIWGWYRATDNGISLSAHYQVAKNSCASDFGSTLRKVVGDVRELSCFNIQGRLSEELVVLASITAGLAHNSRDRHVQASRYFRSALVQSRVHPDLLDSASRSRLSHLAAYSSWMLDDYGTAGFYLDSAIALDPNSWRHHAGRGIIWADQGDYPRALALLDRAVRLSSNNPEAIGSRGEVYRRARDFASARRDLDQAISLKPTLWWLYDERAKLERARGNLVEAERDFSRALATGGVTAACRSYLHNERGGVRYAIYERDPQRNREWLAAASADFSAALELRPDARSARYNRALTYRDLGFLRRAHSDFTRRIAADPNDYATRLGRGRLLMENFSRPAQSISDFDAAVKAQPQKPDAYFYRGLAHLRSGAEREAARDFEQVLQRTDASRWTSPATFWLDQARKSAGATRLTGRV